MLRIRRSRWPKNAAICAAVFLGTSGIGCRSSDPGSVSLVIAATTDVHGRLQAWDYYTNTADSVHTLAGAATIVDSVRRANPGGVVLVDAGDLLQGNPLTFVAAKVNPEPVHPVIAAMNAMQYDAAVIGNHEFNYGVDHLRRATAQAVFPFLAANVFDRNGAVFTAASTVVTRTVRGGAEVRVGIVGGTTPGAMIWDADNLHDAGLRVDDIVPSVQRAVDALQQQHVDVIVVLLHSGLNEPASYDTIMTTLPSENVAERVAQEVPGIDVIVYGHSHKEMIDSLVNGVLLIQPRNWAASVALATMTLERRVPGTPDGNNERRWRVTARKGQSVRVAGHRENADVLAASRNAHDAAVAWATAPIGASLVVWRSDSARRMDSPITDFVNEVMRRETGAQLSATAVFSPQAEFAAGPITLAALSALYPYDNSLRAVKITGTQLRAFLEHSSRYYRSIPPGSVAPAAYVVDSTVPGYNFDVVAGADYTIDLHRPIGSRITSLRIAGRPVQPPDTFTLALNSYRAGGGGGYAMLAGAAVVYQRDVDIRQLLIDEVRRLTASGATLDPLKYSKRNWQIVPALRSNPDDRSLSPDSSHHTGITR